MNYLFTDGGSRGNPGKSAYAAFLFDENMQLIAFDSKYLAVATNNFAEYSALKLGLKLAAKHGVQELTCKLDSELVVKQIKGIYKINDENIKVFYKEIMAEAQNFKKIEFVHVPRAENKHADRLVNIILDAIEAA